jgi:uncharacterized surface protein with fasciclin (FAS1) repeats
LPLFSLPLTVGSLPSFNSSSVLAAAFAFSLFYNKIKIMKKNQVLRNGAIALAAFTLIGSISSCKKKNDPAPNTLVEVASSAGLTSLVSTVEAAGLTNTLRGAGPFTVFAPTNAAFTAAAIPANTPVATLQSVLLYHVFDGKVLAAAVPTTLTAIASKNATTDTLYVKRVGSDVFVNGQRVTTANAEASNGVAHVIGRVLIPAGGRNIVQVAVAAAPALDSLVRAVTLASAGTAAGSVDNIAEVLSNINGATVFAPTNQAFTDLLAQLGVTSLSQVSVATLRQVLRHHVVAGARVFSNDVAAGNVGMANGTNAVIAISGGNATIKGSAGNSATATIVATDIMAKNGVVHLINKVILP